MTDPKQPLYDILKDAFDGGIWYAAGKKGEGPTAASLLFPLAARMETEIAKLHSWQSMETAPRSGDTILLNLQNGEIHSGYYYTDGEEDGWYYALNGRRIDPLDSYPRGWMPLPPVSADTGPTHCLDCGAICEEWR